MSGVKTATYQGSSETKPKHDLSGKIQEVDADSDRHDLFANNKLTTKQSPTSRFLGNHAGSHRRQVLRCVASRRVALFLLSTQRLTRAACTRRCSLARRPPLARLAAEECGRRRMWSIHCLPDSAFLACGQHAMLGRESTTCLCLQIRCE